MVAARDDCDLGQVYAREYDGLVRLAYVTTGSLGAAEEIVQDVVAGWLGRAEQVREPSAYLRRAVVSRCTSWVRRRILERRHSGAAEPSPAEPVHSDTAVVRQALRRLKPRQRAAVFLRYYLDLPETEIAEILGCPVGTVKSLLHRSLATMKEYLGD